MTKVETGGAQCLGVMYIYIYIYQSTLCVFNTLYSASVSLVLVLPMPDISEFKS